MRWLSIILIFSITFFLSCSKKGSSTGGKENVTPAELLDYANKIYDKQDYESAFLAYGLIFHDYPTSREYIDAAIGLSRCYGQFKDYEKEFEILHNLLRENIIPSKVPQIYIAIAEFYERSAGISEQLTGAGTNDFKTALSYYKKAIDYPNSDDKRAKGFAQYRIGELYEEQFQDYDKAIEAFQETKTLYPDEDWALLADEKIGIIQARVARQNLYHPSQKPQTAEDLQTSPAATEALRNMEKPVQKPDSIAKNTAPKKETKSPPGKKPEDKSAPADTSSNKKPELDLK